MNPPLLAFAGLLSIVALVCVTYLAARGVVPGSDVTHLSLLLGAGVIGMLPGGQASKSLPATIMSTLTPVVEKVIP